MDRYIQNRVSSFDAKVMLLIFKFFETIAFATNIYISEDFG